METDWKYLALHALADLQACGIPIEKMLEMTPEILEELQLWYRENDSFT